MPVEPIKLVSRDPTAPRRLQRRGVLIGLVVAVVLLGGGLAAWGLFSRPDRGRPVVLVAPKGARMSLDGRPVRSLAGDGTILFRATAGSHDLAVTLRNDKVVTDQIDVADIDQTLRLELHYDRTYGRWSVVDLDADSPALVTPDAAP
ncbi:MAG: hypothetical protein GXP62_20380 [Oligoflexia bacterium]|nr:hypothetical protein [Oligoflexia bacterium]